MMPDALKRTLRHPDTPHSINNRICAAIGKLDLRMEGQQLVFHKSTVPATLIVPISRIYLYTPEINKQNRVALVEPRKSGDVMIPPKDKQVVVAHW
jgi:hypothetical protein